MSLTLLNVSLPAAADLQPLSGYVYAWSKDGSILGAPVAGVTITATGSFSSARTTDANGFFDFGNVTRPVTLTPSKAEINLTTGNYASRLAELGINADDNTALIAHLDTSIPLTGYALIAADINTTLAISSADRSILQTLLTGSATSINSYNPPTGGNIQKFVDAAYTMPVNPFSPLYPSVIVVSDPAPAVVSWVMVTKGNIA